MDTKVVASAEPAAVLAYKQAGPGDLTIIGKGAIQEKIDQQKDAVVPGLNPFKTATAAFLGRADRTGRADA